MKRSREPRGAGRRTLLIGAFLSGEQLGGVGNREGPCEPTDLVSNPPRGRFLLDRDRMGRVFIKATWWEMHLMGAAGGSPGTLWPLPERGGWSFLSKLQPPVY